MKVLVIGYFGFVTNQIDGQTVKTREIYELLKNIKYDSTNVSFFDTQYFQPKKSSVFKALLMILKTDVLFYLPGEKNLKFLFPLFFSVAKISNTKIIYPVVGGWLANFIKSNKFHKALLRRIDAILVESDSLMREVKKADMKNVEVKVLPNFRIHNFKPNFNITGAELRLVFMARIMKEKGVFRILDLFEKEKFFFSDVKVDFYGPIIEKDLKKFNSQLLSIDNVEYKGIIAPKEVHKVLNNYDALLLPTTYKGEGFPGTIIDSYIAGIPVVASSWKLIPEFIDDSETGILLDIEDKNSLKYAIDKLRNNKNDILAMKYKAYEKSKMYSSEKAASLLLKYIN